MSDRLWRANPAFRRLTVARVVSVGGDSLSLVALMLHVAATSGQALAVAALLLVGDFVPSVLSPFAGALADRFDRKRVMVTCELVQGAVLLVIALTLPALPLLLALVAVRAVAGQVFLPASRAAVPALVAPASSAGPTPRWGSAPTAPRPSGRSRPPRCCRSSGCRGCCWWTRRRSWWRGPCSRLPACRPPVPRRRRARPAGGRGARRAWATCGRTGRCGSSSSATAASSARTGSTTSPWSCWAPTTCGRTSPGWRSCWRGRHRPARRLRAAGPRGGPAVDGRAARRGLRAVERRQPAHRPGLGRGRGVRDAGGPRARHRRDGRREQHAAAAPRPRPLLGGSSPTCTAPSVWPPGCPTWPAACCSTRPTRHDTSWPGHGGALVTAAVALALPRALR